MLKSITGVYIGGVAAVSFADYICNFFLVCFIFDGGAFSVEGGWVAGSGIFSRAGIVFYRNGYFVVLADTTLSVYAGGTPNAHSLGWRGGGVESGSII